ncbi:MAG: PD40 domain-containing protein [Phycisphaerales bacterium]|nr:MAG: PD40 domain-containing protein [Phycisphaerales bacterium]
MKAHQNKWITIFAVGLAVLLSGVVQADLRQGYFTDVKPVPGLDSPYQDRGPSISADGLTIYFCSGRDGGEGDWDIWMSTRRAVGASWGAPINPGPPINSPAWEASPHISADGLRLYFQSWRGGGYGQGDIYVAERASTSVPFVEVHNLGSGVNSPANEYTPSVSPDELTLYLSRGEGADGFDVYVATRSLTRAPFDSARRVANVNSSANDKYPSISSDGLTLFLDSHRLPNTGPSGYEELWVATRSSCCEHFSTPVNLNDFGLGSSVNGPTAVEFAPCISRDWPANGSKLYFAVGISESDSDLYEATWVVPCPYYVAGDLNDDCRVDFLDVASFAANWLIDCNTTPEDAACVPK